MRIYITGSHGQLGRTLANTLNNPHEVFGASHTQVDITDLPAIRSAIGAFQPDLVIHAAAWTDVEGCAREPDRAYRINALGTRNVAVACQDSNSRMLLISTNEVFDGRNDQPYSEFDTPNPINSYARSKYAGEVFVRDLLSRFYIVRVAWLYGYGGNNFVTKIVQRARHSGELRVVTDEIGSPTFTQDVVQAIAQLILSDAYGTYHFTNDGACSRFEFAQHILKLSGLDHIALHPIRMADFQRLSTPPPYTALRNFSGAQLGITLRPWQDALADYVSHERL